MKESLINYIPELIGGIFLVLLTSWLTIVTERSKTKVRLASQKDRFKNEIEKLTLEYDAKLKEKQVNFDHQLKLIEEQHEKDLEKYKLESRDRDVRSIFTGEYNVKDIATQLEGLGGLLEQTKQMNKRLKKVNHIRGKHSAITKRKR